MDEKFRPPRCATTCLTPAPALGLIVMQQTGSSMVNVGIPLIVVLVLFVIIAAIVAKLGRTEHAAAVPWAAIRATVQLMALSAIIAVAIGHLAAILAFLIAMTSIASATAYKRISTARLKDPRATELTGLAKLTAIATTALPVAGFPLLIVAVLVAVGVIPAQGLAIIPVAGILLGNSMGVTALTGRRVHEELISRRGEVEAALSLGFPDAQARQLIADQAASAALIPTMDSTRTVGLVTIPGAFVGMVLGGASPLEAGVMQLFVMLGILAVATVALVSTTALVVRTRL